MAEHYANAVAVRDGCFRMVADHASRPVHCPEPPVWVGAFQDGQRRNHQVRACDGRRGGLVNVRRIEGGQSKSSRAG
jgi:hypothetical protein